MTAKEKYMSTIYSAESLTQFQSKVFKKEEPPKQPVSKLEHKIFGQPFSNSTNRTIEYTIDNLPQSVASTGELKRAFGKAHVVDCQTKYNNISGTANGEGKIGLRVNDRNGGEIKKIVDELKK